MSSPSSGLPGGLASLLLCTREHADTSEPTWNAYNADGDLLEVKTGYTYDQYLEVTATYLVQYVVDDEVIDSENVLYGLTSTTEVTPTKEGYTFKGWLKNGKLVNPATETITENTTFTAVMAGALNTYTWAEISEISEQGLASVYFEVGDTIDVVLPEETITLAIMGFDHDDLSDGTGKANITFGMVNLLKSICALSQSGGNATDDFYKMDERFETILSQMPMELQTLIKNVDKKVTAGEKSTDIVTLSKKLWLFSRVEVDGTTNETLSKEGQQYDYYKIIVDGTAKEGRIKNLKNGEGSVNQWWLRSPQVVSSSSVYYVDTDGTITTGAGYSSFGVCFGFCI